MTLEKLRSLAVQVLATHIELGKKTFWQRSELTPDFEKVMNALDVDVSAVIWSEWIESGGKLKRRTRKRS
jgi:hypothetical protein